MKHCLTVKEAIKKADPKKLFQEVMLTYPNEQNNLDSNGEVSLNSSTISTFLYLDKIKRKRAKKNRKGCYIFQSEWLNFNCETQLFEKKMDDSRMIEIKSKEKLEKIAFVDTNPLPEDYESLSDEEIDRYNEVIASSPDDFVTYAYEFCSASEILGYYIPNCFVKLYGLEKVLAPILFEMTFFGFQPKKNEKVIQKEKKEMEKIVEDIKEEEAVPQNENKKERSGFTEEMVRKFNEEWKRDKPKFEIEYIWNCYERTNKYNLFVEEYNEYLNHKKSKH